MEPLTGAVTFAQIVSLLADYVSNKSARDSLSLNELSEWSVTHGHADIMRAIGKSQAISIGVKAALAEGRTELLKQLHRIEERMAALAAGSGPLDDVARAVRPNAVISEQARELLETLEIHQAEMAIEVVHYEGRGLLLVGSGAGGQFQPSEPRFYEDDLSQLASLGLLSLGYNQSGGRVFRPTRQGSQLAKQLLAIKEGNDEQQKNTPAE